MPPCARRCARRQPRPRRSPTWRGRSRAWQRCAASLPALRHGEYRELHVAAEQLAFLREHPQETLLVAVNAASAPAVLELRLPLDSGRLVDLLNPGDSFPVSQNRVRLDPLPPCWARVLLLQRA